MAERLSPEEFVEKHTARFPDNNLQNIGPEDFRELIADIPRLQTDESVQQPEGTTLFLNTKPFYLAGAPVFHPVAGGTLLFYAKRYMEAAQLPGGVIPTPELDENEFWQNAPLRAGSGAVARQVIGRPAFAYLLQQRDLTQGTEYLVLRQQTGERVPGQQPAMLPSVLAYAETNGSIRPRVTYDPGGLNLWGSYDVATDEFTENTEGGGIPGDVCLGVPGQPDQFYASIDAAREARANDFLGMAMFISSNQLLADGYYGLINMRSLRGNGATIRVSGDALVQLGGPRGFRIEPDLPFNPDTLQLLESIHDCIVSACRVFGDVYSTDTQFVYPPGLIIYDGSRLLLGPGSLLNLDLQVGGQRYFTDNGDGTYTTPQGGLVVDQRGSGPGAGGPAPDLSNYYTKVQSDARYPVLDGNGKVPIAQLPTTVVQLHAPFYAAGAQAHIIGIYEERMVGTVVLSSASSNLVNVSYKKNGVLVSLPVEVALNDKLTVSATADAAGGLIVLAVI